MLVDADGFGVVDGTGGSGRRNSSPDRGCECQKTTSACEQPKPFQTIEWRPWKTHVSFSVHEGDFNKEWRDAVRLWWKYSTTSMACRWYADVIWCSVKRSCKTNVLRNRASQWRKNAWAQSCAEIIQQMTVKWSGSHQNRFQPSVKNSEKICETMRWWKQPNKVHVNVGEQLEWAQEFRGTGGNDASEPCWLDRHGMIMTISNICPHAIPNEQVTNQLLGSMDSWVWMTTEKIKHPAVGIQWDNWSKNPYQNVTK